MTNRLETGILSLSVFTTVLLLILPPLASRFAVGHEQIGSA